MTKTQYFTATSVDGYIADTENSLDWLFEVPRDGGSGAEGFGDFFAGVGAMAMGATTYEWVMEHEDGRWPYTLPTWVFTHRDLPVPDGGAVRLTSEPAVGAHRPLQVHRLLRLQRAAPAHLRVSEGEVPQEDAIAPVTPAPDPPPGRGGPDRTGRYNRSSWTIRGGCYTRGPGGWQQQIGRRRSCGSF